MIGAGLGGLSAARLELRRSGYEVRVLERRPELAEVNTGLSLWALAIRRLADLGLERGAFGSPLERLVHWTSDDAPLTDVRVPRLRGTRSYDVHRGELQAGLAAAIGLGSISLGTSCVDVRETAGRVEVELASGETETSDIVIGADGVHSTVRSALLGPLALRRDEGGVWRGVAELGEERLPRGLHLRYLGRERSSGSVD